MGRADPERRYRKRYSEIEVRLGDKVIRFRIGIDRNGVRTGSDNTPTLQSPVQPGFPVHLLSVLDQIETATGDHLRSTLPKTTTTLFGGIKTMEKDPNLVVLTSDMLFQRIETSLYLFCLFTLQLNNRSAIKAELTVHVEDLTLLFVDGDTNVLLYVTDGPETILQLVKPCVECRDSIIKMIVRCCHGSFQLLTATLGGPDLVN